MNENEFFDWKISLDDELYAVIDEKARKMVSLNGLDCYLKYDIYFNSC